MSQKVLISVVGPTAIGKTKLAIELAVHYKTDIISADSRQFYKELCIGTAVPSQDDLKLVKHHFIQHKSINEPYSVGAFERDALQVLENIFKENDFAIMVGGSGLYSNAVSMGLDHFPQIDPSIRQKLNLAYNTDGIGILQEKLKQVDPEYFEQVDLENPHRLIRALEVSIGSGRPYSSYLSKKKTKRKFKVITLGLTADRALIYDRINTRVDLMLQKGLLNEVKSLFLYKDLNALQTVGYRELFKYLDGSWDLEFAISEIKKNSRRFAKRQLTWFKKNQSTIWINPEELLGELVFKIEKKLEL